MRLPVRIHRGVTAVTLLLPSASGFREPGHRGGREHPVSQLALVQRVDLKVDSSVVGSWEDPVRGHSVSAAPRALTLVEPDLCGGDFAFHGIDPEQWQPGSKDGSVEVVEHHLAFAHSSHVRPGMAEQPAVPNAHTPVPLVPGQPLLIPKRGVLNFDSQASARILV